MRRRVFDTLIQRKKRRGERKFRKRSAAVIEEEKPEAWESSETRASEEKLERKDSYQ